MSDVLKSILDILQSRYPDYELNYAWGSDGELLGIVVDGKVTPVHFGEKTFAAMRSGLDDNETVLSILDSLVSTAIFSRQRKL